MIRAPSFLVAWPSGELEPIFPGNRVYRISPIHAYFNYGSITHASWFGGTAYPSDPYPTVIQVPTITMPICVQ